MFVRRVIKIIARLFHRKSSLSKRPRNPATFQECLETEHPRGSWNKTIVVIVLLLPSIYYMLYLRGSYTEPSNEHFVANEQDTATDFIPETRTMRPRKYYNDLDGLPLCAAVTVVGTLNNSDPESLSNEDIVAYVSTNTSEDKIAQSLDVRMGGRWAPGDCRPRHKVAILVPYWWNRKNNLKIFLYYIHPFLIRQRLEYRIFVIEQHGDEPVNKGRLFNAGFLEIQKNDDWQCVIFHDVDLLPADDRIRYTCPVLPRHMSTVIVGKKNVTSSMKYNTVFGGVTAMTMWHFKKANGYSNLYWGRGESEDMFKRLQAAGLGVMRYKEDIGKYIPLKHSYTPDYRDRIQLLSTAKKRYKDDGLSDLRYNVASYASFPLLTHIVVNVDNIKKPPDYITEASVTLSP